MWRFFKNHLTHPGSWTFLALLSVGIAIAVPPAAPALIIAAAVCTGVAAVTSVPFAWTHKFRDKAGNFDLSAIGGRPFVLLQKHPLQFAIGVFAFALFVTALVLTIGFFTGGAGFVFMAPVFAAIAAPFATAGASAGLSLALSALAGTVFVFASVNIPNTLKRFSRWCNSFIYDAVASVTKGGTQNVPSDIALESDWAEDRYKLAEDAVKKGGYFSVWGTGVKATVASDADKDRFTSPDAKYLYPEKIKRP